MTNPVIDKLVKSQIKKNEESRKLASGAKRDAIDKKVKAHDVAIRNAIGVGMDLDFVKQYSISAEGTGHALENEAASAIDTSIKFNEFTTGLKKVAWATLSKKTGVGASFCVTISPTDPNELGAFKVYYLPWESNRILRLQIPTVANAINGNDPSIFFTAAINGCSIFITGQPDSPTIYHAGTEDQGKVGPGYWRNLFREFSGNQSAHGAKDFSEVKNEQYRANKVPKAGRDDDIAAELRAYMARTRQFTNTNTGMTRQVPDAQPQTRTSLDFAHTAGQQKGIEVVTQDPWGCVFGFRDNNGDWAFYLQKNVTVYFYKLKWSISGSKREATQRVVTMPMEVVQIFPGRAHVRMSSQTKIEKSLSQLK